MWLGERLGWEVYNSILSEINLLDYFLAAGGCRLPEVTRSNKVYQELKGKVDPKELARCLEFEPQDIEDLRDATKSNKDLLSGVLDMWFKGSEPPVCWETIVEAVKCVGNKRLASEIERQHSA